MLASEQAYYQQEINDLKTYNRQYSELIEKFQEKAAQAEDCFQRLAQENTHLRAHLEQSQAMYAQLLKVVEGAITAKET